MYNFFKLMKFILTPIIEGRESTGEREKERAKQNKERTHILQVSYHTSLVGNIRLHGIYVSYHALLISTNFILCTSHGYPKGYTSHTVHF